MPILFEEMPMKSLSCRCFCPAVGTIALLLAESYCAAEVGAPEKRSPAPDAAASNEADHDALRALVPIYEQAANQGKPELLKPYLDPEFSGVMITGDPVDSYASLEGYWAKVQKFLGEGGKYHGKVEVAVRSIVSGDLAMARGTTDEEVTTTSGKQYRYPGQWTAICRKRDGQWRILRVQGSMDAISNPFITAAVSNSLLLAGVVAGIVGLVVGWLAHVLLSRRRKAAGST